MTALWIAHVTVTDEETYARYREIAGESVAEFGGEFIARGGRYQQMEGRDHSRNVVARFPTFEAAVDCYNSPRYQEAVAIAKVSSERDLVIVESDG